MHANQTECMHGNYIFAIANHTMQLQLHAVSCSCMDIAKQYITKADPERFQAKGVATNVCIEAYVC